MKRAPLWAVFTTFLVVFFVLCTALFTRFPFAVSGVVDTVDGSPADWVISPWQWFWTHFQANAPFWVLLSALLAGIGTVIFARALRKRFAKTA